MPWVWRFDLINKTTKLDLLSNNFTIMEEDKVEEAQEGEAQENVPEKAEE